MSELPFTIVSLADVQKHLKMLPTLTKFIDEATEILEATDDIDTDETD